MEILVTDNVDLGFALNDLVLFAPQGRTPVFVLNYFCIQNNPNPLLITLHNRRFYMGFGGIGIKDLTVLCSDVNFPFVQSKRSTSQD